MGRKVVLVTGASKGIGRSACLKFASQGYDIVLHYLTSEKEALALKEEITSCYEVDVLLCQADIRREAEVKLMFAKVKEKYKQIDVLVNNAALAMDDEPNDKLIDDFRQVIDTNLVGTFIVSRCFGKEMYLNKRGVIINIASTNGIDTNNPISMDYDASKAGVISLTNNLANLYAPYVRVVAVAPGWTDTESVLTMNPNYRKEEAKKILLQRFATSEEVANVIFFLASKEASYINKTVIRVDGGISNA